MASTIGDNAGAFGADDHAAVLSDGLFHAGGDNRGIGAQQRHSLALHVDAHQGAVGVVVFEERNQRGRDGDRLPRADVDVLDFFAGDGGQVALHAGQHQALLECADLSPRRRAERGWLSFLRRHEGICARR